jgi:NAD(P)H dehydrogenase (quinone)
LTEEARKEAQDLGERVAEVTTWLAWGRDEWQRQQSAEEWKRRIAGQ